MNTTPMRRIPRDHCRISLGQGGQRAVHRGRAVVVKFAEQVALTNRAGPR
jgi:hypothetical protein